MSEQNKIQLFENQPIRTAWNEEQEEWYFSVVDVIHVLTGSENPRRYWSDLKRKLKSEGATQLYENTLALDHTSLNTVAAGYATKNYTVTETKTIGQLDRNDMSYVPATTIKNGRTLSLANVEWQVTGTDLVGEALMPSQYQAVATYSAKASYQAATGYVTTAEYVGDVTHEGVESVTYVLTYIGTEANHKGAAAAQVGAFFADHFPWILGGIVLICAAVGGTLLVCRRKAVVKAECEADETEENEEDQEA